jgi:FkbM family methyltransferase
VAFDSGLKREATLLADLAMAPATEPGLIATARHRRFKTLVRGIARAGYRWLKPLFRPIAFRGRRYLLQPLREDLERSSASIHAELQSLRNELRLALPGNSAKSNCTPPSDQHHMERFPRHAPPAPQNIAVSCGGDTILLPSPVGFILCPSSELTLLAHQLNIGDLGLGARLLIQRYLHPADVFIDVGANIGLHTLAAAKQVGVHGHIIACEPSQPRARALERSVWLNGLSDRVEVHWATPSNIHECRTHFLATSIASSHHHQPDDHALSRPPPQQAPVITLDAIAGAIHRIDLIRLNADDLEPALLDGAKTLLANHPDIAVIVDSSPSHLHRVKVNPTGWLHAFENLGFEHCTFHPETGRLERKRSADQQYDGVVNFFFSRSISLAGGRL